ncbi:MAG: M20/M25/M40 family metallo-hydrolase [Rhodospirillales bacterium]|nr:M20/M25/M40 family metallo-hydrolase [Rhodospirillales bacterium]MBO6785991.1 M20/M25/M40 family metallo-hydrolase [Rhodospirillales bacterium]
MNATFSETIAEFMVKHRAAQFALLKKLVQIDTETRSDALMKASDKVAALLEDLDFEVERHAPDAERLEAAGIAGVQNLVARKQFGHGPVLALVCHVDTVEVPPGWTFEPLGGDIDDGSLYGLGAVSGKGSLAAQVFAVLALEQVGVPVTGAVELHISFDGESGGALGAKWLLAEEIVKPDMVIAGGPARAVATQSTGTMLMDVEVHGKAAPAHAPDRGTDALEAATHALSRLYQFRGGLKAHASATPGIGAPTMVVEHISGGHESGVPEFVAFRIDRRILPDEDPAQVEKQLTNMIGSTIAKMPGARCRIRRSVMIPAMGGDESTAPLVDALEHRLAAKIDTMQGPYGIAYDHEGRHYAAAGIPTVMYGAGPLDPVAAGLHGADEHLVLDDLRLATEVLALSAMDILSGKMSA